MSLDQSAMVTAARDLLERADPMTAGLWPRAAALLTRQALEAALDALWCRRAPGLELCSVRAQMLCLPSYLHSDDELAERISYTWTALSRACHHHPYELSPTSSELLGWVSTVEQLINRVKYLEGDRAGGVSSSNIGHMAGPVSRKGSRRSAS
jgi:hypothetical protein